MGPAAPAGAGHARALSDRTLCALCVQWQAHVARGYLSPALEHPGGTARIDHNSMIAAAGDSSAGRRAVAAFLQVPGRAIVVAGARALTGTAFALRSARRLAMSQNDQNRDRQNQDEELSGSAGRDVARRPQRSVIAGFGAGRTGIRRARSATRTRVKLTIWMRIETTICAPTAAPTAVTTSANLKITKNGITRSEDLRNDDICSSLFVILYFLLRLLHRQRSHFNLSLRVGEVAKFRRDASSDRRGLAATPGST